ncbi:hypothetical protein GCM10027418_16260 [Mariniluteicoccus endophyticus]
MDLEPEPTEAIHRPEPTLVLDERTLVDQPAPPGHQVPPVHQLHQAQPAQQAWPAPGTSDQAFGGPGYAYAPPSATPSAYLGYGQPSFPPQGVPTHEYSEPYAPVAKVEPRPRGRVLPAVVASAIVAALVGGAAGYGGAQLTDGRSGGVPSSAPQIQQQPVPPAQSQADTVKVAERVLPSTVTIAYNSGGRSGTGSGFVIDDQGHIMTNNHVVEGASDGRVTIQLQDGTRRSAEVVGRSPGYDLAVIKADDPKGLPKVDLGDSASVRPGQQVVAVGAPLGLGGSVTAGIVSAVDRPLSVGNNQGTDDSVAYINGIQIDAPINPGNSGGPLADGAGRIIGVNSAILTLGGASQDAQQGNIGLGFAIPINQAVDVANQIMSTGKARFPVIGATISGDQSGGVRLASIVAGGPAAQAGLRSGDVIEEVDGRIVRTATEMIVRIRAHKPGDTITLTVAGRGDVKVTLGGKEG